MTLDTGTTTNDVSIAIPDLVGQSILARVGAVRGFDLGHALRWASAARGISQTRLAVDIFMRKVGPQKLTPEDYFHFGLHLGHHSRTTRAEYIGAAANRRLNAALTDRAMAQLTHDKIATAKLLEQAGLPTPAVRAVFAVSGAATAKWTPTLTSLDELTGYLRYGVAVPFFGKPVYGSAGQGAFSVVARQGADQVVFGDGRVVGINALAAEIARNYPQGFMFQDKLVQHPVVAALAGPVMCSVRVMSVWTSGQFTPLYAGMRLPYPGAMTDITCTSTAAIDMVSGRITRTQDGRRLGGHSLTHSLITSAALIGALLPDWERVMALARAAHGLVPTQAVLGTDFALTPDGPLIVELNTHPGHGGYHQTNDRGILNPVFRKVFAAALAERGITRRGRGMLVP